MKLVGVTAYVRDSALLTYTAEAECPSGESTTTLLFKDLGCHPTRASVTSDNPAVMIDRTAVLERPVTVSAFMSSSKTEPEVKQMYEDLLAKLKALDYCRKEVESAESKHDTLINYSRNLIAPEVLAEAGYSGAVAALNDVAAVDAEVGGTLPTIADGYVELLEKAELLNAEAEALREQLGQAIPSLPWPCSYDRRHQLESAVLDKQNAHVYDLEVGMVSPTDQAVKATLHIELQVPGCEWSPSYEVKLHTNATDASVTCELHYFANLVQNTGVLWPVGVPISLSTSESDRPCAPEPPMKTTVDYKKERFHHTAQLCSMNVRAAKCFGAGAPPPSAPVEVTEAFSSPRILLPTDMEVASSSATRKLTVAKLDLPATLCHHVVLQPGRGPAPAFRALLLQNTSDWTIRPHNSVAVFIDGSLIGETRIHQMVAGGENFVVYVGVDELVKVEEKENRKYMTSTGVFTTSGKKMCVSRGISVHNQHESHQLKVVVSFPQPESKHKDIVVDYKDAVRIDSPSDLVATADSGSKTVRNATTGNCVMVIPQLKAKSMTDVKCEYTISYPAAEQINFLN